MRFAATGLVVILSVIPAVGLAQATDVVSPQAELGFQQISQCLQSNNNMAVLLAVDESASLRNSDPNDQRAKLLSGLVESLGGLANQRTATGTRHIDVAVSTFAVDYRPLVPWTELNPETTASVSSTVESQIPNLDNGGGTNHPAAVAGARNQFAQINADAPAGQRPCEVLIMFTDGVLDTSNGASANQQAADRMCATGGPIDGIRRDGIHLVTVMLFDPADAAANPKTFAQGRALLKAAAEGEAGSQTCGTVPIPAKFASGAYLEGRVDALAALFAGAFALSEGATQITGTGPRFDFQVDPGIESFRIVGLARQGLTVTKPNGQTIAIARNAAGSEGVDARWDAANVTADVSVGSGDVGKWTVERPNQDDGVSVYLFTGLGLKLDDTLLMSGEPAQVKGHVVRLHGDAPVDLSVYQSSSISASSVGGSAVPLTLKSDGSFSGPFTATGQSTTAVFDVTVALVTSSGQQLAPLSGRFNSPVALPKEFPAISPSSLVLSSLIGADGAAKGSFDVIGSAEGPTQVCLEGMQYLDVDDPARYQSSQEVGCFSLEPGQKRTFDVAVTSKEAADEQVQARVPMTVTSASAKPRKLTVELPVSFVVARPVDQVIRAGLVLALLVLGVAIPLGAMIAVNRWLARFRVEDGVRVGSFPVQVSSAGIREPVLIGAGREVTSESDDVPVGTGQGLRLPPANLRFLPPMTSSPREVVGPDGSILLAKAPRIRALFGAPSASVLARPGFRVFSNESPFISANGAQAPVSLGVGGSWYVTVSEEDLVGADLEQGVRGTLSVFVPPRSGSQEPVEATSLKIRQFAHTKSILKLLQNAVVQSRPTVDPSSGSGPTGSGRTPPPGPGRKPSGPAPGATPPPGPGRRSSAPTGPASGTEPVGGAAPPSAPGRRGNPPPGPGRTRQPPPVP